MPHRKVPTPYIGLRHAFVNGELVTFGESQVTNPMVEDNIKSMNARRITAAMVSKQNESS